MLLTKLSLTAVVALLLTASVSEAQPPADSYPSRPIKFIVTYPPGGGNDIIARLLAQNVAAAA